MKNKIIKKYLYEEILDKRSCLKNCDGGSEKDSYIDLAPNGRFNSCVDEEGGYNQFYEWLKGYCQDVGAPLLVRKNSDLSQILIIFDFGEQNSEADFFSFVVELNKQGALPRVVCSYLFAYHNVLCTPSVSISKAIEIYISPNILKDFFNNLTLAFKDVIDVLTLRRSDRLLSQFTSSGSKKLDAFDRKVVYRKGGELNNKNINDKVLCAYIPKCSYEIANWDLSLIGFSEKFLLEVWAALCDVLDPFFLDDCIVDSAGNMLGVYIVPAVSAECLDGNDASIKELVLEKDISNNGQQDTPKVCVTGKSEEALVVGLVWLLRAFEKYLNDVSRKVTVLVDSKYDAGLNFVYPNKSSFFNFVDDDGLRDADIIILQKCEATTLEIRNVRYGAIIVDLYGGVRNLKLFQILRMDVLYISDVVFDFKLLGSQFFSIFPSCLLADFFFENNIAGDLERKVCESSDLFRCMGCENVIFPTDFFGEYGVVSRREIIGRLEKSKKKYVSVNELSNMDVNYYSRPPLYMVGEERTNICDYIFRYDGGKALVDPGTKKFISYAELYDDVRYFAGKLSSDGVSPSDVIMMAGEDDIKCVVLMLACFWCGAIFCPINFSGGAREVGFFVSTAKPKKIFCDKKSERLLSTLGCSDRLEYLEAWMGESRESERASGSAPMSLDGSHPAIMLFTSGSTGFPKAVLHEHKDFILCWYNYVADVVGLKTHDCVYSPSRLFFTYGLNSILISLFSGATHVLACQLCNDQDYMDVLRGFGVTVFFCVPIILKLIVRGDCFKTPSLRLCISAGEALPAHLYYEVKERLGWCVLDGIGATESLSTFISNRVGNERVGSSGKLVPGFSAKIVDGSGCLCEAGEVGALWIKGDTLVRNYVGRDDASELSFNDGWFNTQDLFYTDAEGYFYNVGRPGVGVKVNGVWYSPQIVEGVLNLHPLVEDCMISFKEDEYGLSRPVALVVLASEVYDLGKLWDEVRSFLSKSLNRNQIPHFFRLVPSVPRTASGKLKRNVLRCSDYI